MYYGSSTILMALAKLPNSSCVHDLLHVTWFFLDIADAAGAALIKWVWM